MILSLALTSIAFLVGLLGGRGRRSTVDRQVISCLHGALTYEQNLRAIAEEQFAVISECPPILRKRQVRIIDVTRN